ncbi:MAG: hypothetical protein AB7F23_01200 [Phycisphaerae bacterium]|jgi:hypothetical protein
MARAKNTAATLGFEKKIDLNTNLKLFELCYDQYKAELGESDKIYQKCSIMILVVPVLIGVLVKIGDMSLFQSVLLKDGCGLWQLLYVIGSVISIVLICMATYNTAMCVIPRQYKSLNTMVAWYKYFSERKDDSCQDDSSSGAFSELSKKLSEAKDCNDLLNEKRRQHFGKSIRFACYSLIPLALQALVLFVIKITG